MAAYAGGSNASCPWALVITVPHFFDSTLPTAADPLMRVSEFTRQQDAAAQPREPDTGATQLGALNPSLMQDLLRFERDRAPGSGLDVLEVLAAARRHGRALLLHLQLDYRVLPLTVLPPQQQVLSPLPLRQLLQLRLPDIRVLRVEPALAASAAPTASAASAASATPADAGDAEANDMTEADDGGAARADAEAVPMHLLPLGVLLWELALRGAREDLLPEIAGIAAYRVAPGTDLGALDLSGSMAAAVATLRHTTSPLREIATWEGFDRARAMRMLNGLYLQAGLMVTRTHPGAIT